MPSSRPPPGFSARPQKGSGPSIGGGEAEESAPINIPWPRPRYPAPDWGPYMNSMWAPPTPDPAENLEIFQVGGCGGLAWSFRREFKQPSPITPSGTPCAPRTAPPQPPALQQEDGCPLVIGFAIGKMAGARELEVLEVEASNLDDAIVEGGEAQDGETGIDDVAVETLEGGRAEGEKDEDAKVAISEIEPGEMRDGKEEIEEAESESVEGWKCEAGEVVLGKMEIEQEGVERVEGELDHGDLASERPLPPQGRRRKFKFLGCISAIGTIVVVGGRILLKSRH